MSSNSDKFETLISFVSHIDDSNLSSEIQSLQNKIKKAENAIAVKGSTKELEEGLKNLESQVDSLYSRFEKFIPRIQEAQTLGIKFSNIKLDNLVSRFYDLGRSVDKAKSNLQDTYSKLQEFVGSRGEISAPDFSKSGLANIQAWKQQLQDLGATDVVFKGLTIQSATFEEALTGLGIRITKVTQDGTQEFQKLSAAGEALAQTFHNMGDSAFAAFDTMDDPQKLQALSDKIQKIRMNAWSNSQDNKINRETFKMGIADGISKEVASADAALDKFMTAFRNKNNITIEEAQRTAKELGGSLNFSNIITNQAGEFHASAQLITKDLQTISFSLRSYKEQTEKGDVWGVTTGGVTQLGNIIKQTLGEYQSGLAKSLQLRQQLSQAEQSGNQYAVNLLQQELDLTEQHNAGLRTTLENIQWTQTAMEGLTAAEAQHQQTLNLDAANKQWEQERVAIDGVIQKYNELKQAQLKVQQTSLNNAPKAERQMAMAEQVKATTEFQKAQASLAPHLQNNKRLIDGMADADAKATAATLKLTSAANAQGFSLKALGAQFKTLATNVLQYQLAWKGFQAIIDTIKKVIATTKELDSAMMNIRLVTGQTQEQVHDLMNSYAELGKSVGATATEVSEGAIGWLRQGRTLSETTKLIETSTKLSKLGMMESSEATQLLTATLNGFNVAVSDSESIVDKLVRVDMNFATSTQELATALQYTAASANLAGVSLDQMIGLIATVSATTRRSAESIGQSFKTMFSRLQRVSAGKQLDEYGESLNDVEKRLRTFGIELRNANNEWRNEWEVMSEIGDRWKEFSNVEKSAIAEVMGGTRQRENLLVVFENWDKVLKATTISMNSAGTAEEKYSAYMDSLEAKTKQFTATWQELVNNLSTGDTLKGFVDFGTRILEVVDKFHLLQIAMYTALGAGGFKLFSKGIVALDQALNGVSRTVSSLYNTTKPALFDLAMAIKTQTTDTEQYVRLMGNVTQQFQAFDPAMQARILNEMGLNQQLKERIANELGLQVSGGKVVVTTEMETAATQRLSLAMKNLGANLKAIGTFLLTNPLGWVLIAVGAVVAAVKIFDALTTTFEEHRETIDRLKQEYQSLEGELSKLQGELQTTKDRIKELEEASKKGEITLVEAEELKNLRLTNVELEREVNYRQKLAELKKEELQNEIRDAYEPDAGDRFAERGGLNPFKRLSYAVKTRGLSKTGDPLDDYRNEINQIQSLKRELKGLEEARAQAAESGNQKAIDDYNKQIKKTEEIINNLSNSTNEFTQNLLDDIAQLDADDPLRQRLEREVDYFYKVIDAEAYFSIKLSELSTKLDANGKKTAEYKQALDDLANEVIRNSELWDILKDSMGLTPEEIDAIERRDKSLEEYGTAIDKIKDKLDSEELKAEFDIDTSGLEDAEKKVSALASAIDNFKDKAKDLKEAIDELNSSGGLSLETISDLAQKFPELEDALSLYLAGVKSDVELQKLLQQEYNKTTNEYKQSLIDKLSTSEEFYNAQIKDNNELNSTLGKLYGIDVKNYSTIEQLKAEIARRTEASIVSAFSPLPLALDPAWQGMAQGFTSRCNAMASYAAATANAIARAFASAFGVAAGVKTGAAGLMAGVAGAVKQGLATKAINDALGNIGDLGAGALGGAPTGGGSPSGGSSGGSGEDTWKAEFEAAKAQLEHLRKMDVISTKEYYDSLDKLVEKYYRGNEKYIEELKSEEESLYDLRHELYEENKKDIDIQIEMLENQVGQEDKILQLYEKKKEQAHLEAERLRKEGVKDETDAIKDLQADYREADRQTSDILEDILDEQEENLKHTKNLLELSGNLTVDKELALAQTHYNQIIEHYQKYKQYYDKDLKAYRSYIDAKNEALEDLHDASIAVIDDMLDKIDDRVARAEATLNYTGLNVVKMTQDVRKALEQMARDGWISIEDFQEKSLELLQREREAIDNSYEKIKNASIKNIEKQIKALEDEKDTTNEYYDERISRIRSLIDAMDKETDRENKLLDLEKKRLALQKARTQKTARIYRKGIGFVWEADPDALAKATDDYNDAIRDYNNWQKKLDLQGQIDDFEKAKEANEKNINEQIDKLNELREAWEKSMDLDPVFDEYEQSLMDLMDDESLTFDQRMAKVNEFTESYIARINDISEANNQLQATLDSMMNNTSATVNGGTGRRTWYATKEGTAPLGAREGDVILTAGGSYQIVAPNTAGASFNKESQLWSIKLDDVKTVITDDIAGTVKQTRSINTNTNALLNNTVTTNVLNQNVNELDNTTTLNSRQLSNNSTALHENIEALEDVEQALQYFPENLQGAVATALSGLNLNGNGGAGGHGGGGYTGSWRKTTYSYELNGKTYTGVGYTQGMANFDEYQKAAGISGAKLISASTGGAEKPPSGAIIEKTTTGLVKSSSGGGKSGTIASLGNGQTVVVNQTKTITNAFASPSSSSSSSSKGSSSSSSSSSSVSSRGNLSSYRASKNASGTLSSTPGLSFVDELGEELIIRPPSQGRLTYLEKGAGVIPADITKNLWKIGQNPNDFFQEEFDKQINRYNGFSWDTSGGAISIVIGDINLSGVQDVNGLSKAIVSRLPSQIIRDLYK